MLNVFIRKSITVLALNSASIFMLVVIEIKGRILKLTSPPSLAALALSPAFWEVISRTLRNTKVGSSACIAGEQLVTGCSACSSACNRFKEIWVTSSAGSACNRFKEICAHLNELKVVLRVNSSAEMCGSTFKVDSESKKESTDIT
ncbi:unnamed protein product [Cuscuta epithymum]|uniref:Uncharacterized protein n=1 Tax=Cuscuta epithymum TaxID=186058 RepID=A0AAV0C6S7_9ASTE|nr:unnamed protein product [Cuscuta epithymum]